MRGLSPNWLLGTETLHLYIRRSIDFIDFKKHAAWSYRGTTIIWVSKSPFIITDIRQERKQKHTLLTMDRNMRYCTTYIKTSHLLALLFYKPVCVPIKLIGIPVFLLTPCPIISTEQSLQPTPFL